MPYPGVEDPQLKGFLELPAAEHQVDVPLAVSGWVFSLGAPVSILELVLDGGEPQEILYGLARADVTAVCPEPAAAQSGFAHKTPLKSSSVNGTYLQVEIFATLENGRRIRCFARRVRLLRSGEAAGSRFLRGAAEKAWIALREGRFVLSPRWWAKALFLHWQETHVAEPIPVGPHAMDRDRLESSYQRWLRSQRESAQAPITPSTASGRTVGFDPPMTIVALIDDSSTVSQLVESVRTQSGQTWALWLVALDDAPRPATRSGNAQDSRIHWVELRDLVRADGTWSPPGQTDYLVLLNPNTLLAPDALRHLTPFVSACAADWIYTDDDRLDADGRRLDPYLKGAFSPELALVDDYATRLAVVRRSAVERAGGIQSACKEAQVYDLFLRVAALGGSVQHVAEVGCHRRHPLAAVLGPHHRSAAQRIMAGRGVAARIGVSRRDSPTEPELSDIAWPSDVIAGEQVTIVIPTRDRSELLTRCVESLRRTVDLGRTRLLIVDDCSEQDATRSYLEALQEDPALRCRVIRPGRRDNGFNYARLMNVAAGEVDTNLILHLNNDIEAISRGWLDRMTGWLAFDDIGVVGAKLLYPDGSIQHAGVIVSTALGAPGHLFARLRGEDMGYQWLPHRVRNVSAVTGACLLTRTSLFREVGGFDEDHLAVQFNDTDYCLRVIAAGKRVVYEPAAVLSHHESVSRGRDTDYREALFFMKKYRAWRDPFASPRLDIASLYGPTPLVAS